MNVAEPVADPLYEAHRKVYAREVSGRFARLRNLCVVVLLGIFYALPWLRWNGRQAVLFDLPARKFFLFGLTIFPQDFYLLTWLLIIAALSLFYFTALAGTIVVRLCVSADRLDRDLRMDGTSDRRQPVAANETRPRCLVGLQDLAQGGQAGAVGRLFPDHRGDVRRLLLLDRRIGRAGSPSAR